MFYSKKYKLLFIASPKTGTVSIHEALEKIDQNGSRRIIEISDKVISGKELDQGIIGHARAREIKKALGANQYISLNTMAFIRNPYSKLVSSYFFNRSNSVSQAFKIKGNKNKLKRSINYFLTTFFAKILPFKIWALFYPYRSNMSYLTDYDGSLIIDHIGRTEFLNEDFQSIMKKLGINTKDVIVGKKNVSNHKAFEKYFKSNWFKYLIYKKLKSDIDFYNNISKNHA
tara:strand:+ start:1477 stop:2163 length:687 start_codon:yes stop_codon:yes gene_type:complete